MDNGELLTILNRNYPLRFVKAELLREGGSASYAVYAEGRKYFLKTVSLAFADTFQSSVDIHLHAQRCGIAVPPIVMTTDGQPFVRAEDTRVILCEFVEFTEIDMQKDAEEVGATVGKLHRVMSAYKGELISHDRAFYLDRYLRILDEKRYPRAEAFAAYGEALWERVAELPRGYCHGDLYCGNIQRGADGRLYILDFDASCLGFPTYDLALIANQTDYFAYDERGLPNTTAIYRRLLSEYLKRRPLSEAELRSLYDMLALYHYALQATIIEIYGMNCVDEAFFDAQLSWLTRWRAQSKEAEL